MSKLMEDPIGWNSPLRTARYEIEGKEGWREAIDKIPAIKFPADWGVKMIPPFGGAMARFQVILPRGDTKSVYLYFYERLGFFGGKPYWEVYPVRGDVGRCALDDTQELLRLIVEDGGE